MARGDRKRPRPSMDNLLDDPAVSCPLRAVLIVWRGRDPVDAARDAALLAKVMDDRTLRMMEPHHGSP